jgi:hypothetical protein
MTKSLLTQLGTYQSAVHRTLSQLKAGDIIGRIWDYDHTVWQPDPEEITNRLGWLHLPENMPPQLGEIQALVDGVKADGYTNVLLLGMGGSSLAP